MDPFLVLLHSLSGSLSSSNLTELKFLCRERVGKRKLERVQSGLDLFSVLLEQKDLEPARTGLLRELLASLRRHDLLQRLDDFEAGVAAAAAPGEAGGLAGGRLGGSWRPRGRGMGGEAWPGCSWLTPTRKGPRARPLFRHRLAETWKDVCLVLSVMAGLNPGVLLPFTRPKFKSPQTCSAWLPSLQVNWKTQLRNGCG